MSSNAILESATTAAPSKPIAPSMTKTGLLGVTTLPVRKPSSKASQRFLTTLQLCRQNAEVCEKHGQTEKAKTWSYLGETIQNHMEEFEADSFSGWGGSGGGALGRNLAANVLQYYEAEGDIQMVATIVCVLGSGQRKAPVRDERSFLLSPDQDAKYDMYIRRYADMLYSWHLSAKRAELSKHLVQLLPKVQDARIYLERGDGKAEEKKSGVKITLPDGTLTCAICENSVRGLCITCHNCGHGGHMHHIMEWFREQTLCPTGCGCVCVPMAVQQGCVPVTR